MQVIRPDTQFLYGLKTPHRNRHTVFKHQIEQNKKAISVEVSKAERAHLDHVEASNLMIQLIEQVKRLTGQLSKKEGTEKAAFLTKSDE